MTPKVSVIIPTHDPNPGRLCATLRGLSSQTLSGHEWEVVVVNNASARWPDRAFFSGCGLENITVVSEPNLGLTSARIRGLDTASADICVLVDDDNVLAPDYLAKALAFLISHPRVGAAGGKSVPLFEKAPPDWTAEFYSLLALRDLGDKPLVSTVVQEAVQTSYPTFAPIGAGMVLRREAWISWLEDRRHGRDGLSDRRGTELTSSGDNDIILCAMRAGWDVAYVPALLLHHLIPPNRLDPAYLARLNHGIQKSWMNVLMIHGANPWPSLTARGCAVRKLKAWLKHRPWSSPAAYIRWKGACGHFEGRVVTRRQIPQPGNPAVEHLNRA